jgi:hypothetical protein
MATATTKKPVAKPKGKVDYAKIGAAKIHKPGQKPKRILVYGRNKKGKTRFGYSAPNCLILDPEIGTEELPDDANIWPINKWEDMEEAFRFLKSGQHEYDWVCVDGLTRINNMALRFVMKQQEERDLDRIPGMVQQKDYGKSGELMKGMLFNFHYLPMGVVYTCQERMEIPGEFESEDEDVEEASARFVPDLPKGVRSAVNAIVNVIGRIYTVKVEIKEREVIQRRLWIAPAESLDTGVRSKHKLPEYVKNPTVPKLVELMNTGKVTK